MEDNTNINDLEEYIVSHFNEALEKGYLDLVFQPIVRTISNALCSVEGLSRWNDPLYGEIEIEKVVRILEKAKLIHILDIHVINKICKIYHERQLNNDPLLPVAFNLSRLDFYLCDIYQEVENAIQKYDVPRDMISIEITENIFVQNLDVITKAIEKFHNAGYKIYLDDFGKGYSSLNILKDHNFDLLKIDMEFLSTFNKKSKDIITSTVQMAKKIGVHTLAEGVETQEQFDFLRDIGCEKVQGFLIGKPKKIDEVIKQAVENNRIIETVTWRKYYDSVGLLDFSTDKPLAILEYTPQRFIFRFMNKSFEDVLNSIGSSRNLAIDGLNVNSSISRYLNKFVNQIIDDGSNRSTIIPIGSSFLKLDASIISICNNYTMLNFSITNITRDEGKDFNKQLDSLLRNLLYLYSNVKYIDLNDNSYIDIDKLTGVDISKEKKYDLDSFSEYYIENVIYKPDRERFRKFISQEYRKSNKGKDIFAELFRTKDKNGEYILCEHTIFCVPNTNEKVYFACVRQQNYTNDDIANIFKNNIKQDKLETNEDMLNSYLWKNLMSTSDINFFWKDKDRRFLGASESFLKVYGIKDVNELIGNTDEDMHWHVYDDPYKNDEYAVLQEGKIIRNSQGKCVIKGVVHNISANKFPIYVDGKIIGLLGFFVDIDEYNKSLSVNKANSTYDSLTNVNNSRGFFEHLSGYNEAYRLRRTDFAVVKVDIPEYLSVVKNYGTKIGNTLLKLIADKIVINCMTTGSVAHITEAKFLIIYRYKDQVDMKDFLTRIKNEIDNIHLILDYPVTLFAHIGVIYASETNSLEDLIERIVALKI
ncbi:MAG: EAL domain-containing protein [Acholeplasmatales bacterium]|nr:EAL domain-containing protein [Acholeplasmatales bacterium]